MEFLDPDKRRSYNIRLFVGFVLVAIALILGTTILALITAGYNINRKTGQVYQNGLVFINAQPTAANIYINGVNSGTTNAKLELPAGTYNVSLSEPNYHGWSNSLTLYGSDVQELVYPFLFPLQPERSSVLNVTSQPQLVTSSPDRHWLLVSVPGQAGQFSVLNLTNRKAAITSTSIPNNLLATQTGDNTLSLVQWSTDNQHVLLKDTYSGGIQYIMFNWKTPTDSYNVNQTFPNTPITDIKLDNNVFSKLYLFNQATGNLVLGDSTTKATTQVLSNVLGFWPYGSNQILYADKNTGSTSVADINIWLSTGKIYKVRELPISSAYLLNVASYSGATYYVVGSTSSRYTYIYMNPLDQLTSIPNQTPLPYTLLVSTSPPSVANFSNSAQYIEVQTGSQFSIYNIRTQTHYRYDTQLSFTPNQLATWMDGDRLCAIINNKLTIWDFDGTNKVTYVDASSTYLPDFSQNYDSVYTAIPTPNSTTGQWQIERNSLIANKP